MKRLLRQFLPWFVYPVVLIPAFLLHFILLGSEVSLLSSTFLPIIVATLLVTVLERLIPQRPSWQPTRDDIQTDLWFMLTVQLVLPKLLAFLAVLSLIEPLRDWNGNYVDIWPHHWPIAAQAVLLVVVGDFMRYWLHRAAHNVPLLWRLHAVHHSPDKLYWLNVGRFHPVEKGLQFIFDSLPFLFLGVHESVIALYFLFYSVNGFFLHSNIMLRYGVLNYLINTAELHRWHHSLRLSEANHNFGNNTIIWDLLFGTFYLPKDREVGTLGNNELHYPKNFIGQLHAPFHQRRDNDS